MRNLRVAHIASGDLWAGAEVQLYTLALQLQNHPEIKLHVCLFNRGELYKKLRLAGITVSIFAESEMNALAIIRALHRTLRRFKPDVIHTHRQKENIIGSIVALLLGSTPSLRTVHGAAEHSHGILKLQKRVQCYMDYLCGRHLQKLIIAVADDLAEKLTATFPPRKVSTILNGVDYRLVNELALQRPQLLGAAELTKTKICFAGRLVQVKRLDLWLETAAELNENRSHQFSFYIIGDGPEKARLTALAQTLGLTEVVYFLGEQHNVPAILHAMDMLLITSDHEGLPMVVLEAMCVGTVVVAHSVGGISNLLENGQAGYLVTRHNSAGYAEKILECLDQPNKASAVESRARTLVETTYAAKTCAEKYVAKYFELGRLE